MKIALFFGKWFLSQKRLVSLSTGNYRQYEQYATTSYKREANVRSTWRDIFWLAEGHLHERRVDSLSDRGGGLPFKVLLVAIENNMPVALGQPSIPSPLSWNLTIDATTLVVTGSMSIGTVMVQLVNRLGRWLRGHFLLHSTDGRCLKSLIDYDETVTVRVQAFVRGCVHLLSART